MADQMVDFFTAMMSHTATWLMTEPIVYFTAIFLGVAIVGLIKKMMHI